MGYLEDRAGLAGKVAVITGGAGGLGWPIARDLARAGVHVAICDRDADALSAIATEIGNIPVKSLLRHADVREPEAMAAFFAASSSSRRARRSASRLASSARRAASSCAAEIT